jgi:hypothetical protein
MISYKIFQIHETNYLVGAKLSELKIHNIVKIHNKQCLLEIALCIP